MPSAPETSKKTSSAGTNHRDSPRFGKLSPFSRSHAVEVLEHIVWRGLASDRICEWVARKASRNGSVRQFTRLTTCGRRRWIHVIHFKRDRCRKVEQDTERSTQESIIICRSLKPKPSSSLWLASDHLTLVSSAIFPPGSRSYEISCCFCQTIGSTSRCKTATLPSLCCPESDGAELRGEQVWYHVAGIQDAAWCYPEPAASRENLKNHITFATGKGIAVREHSDATHDSAAPKKVKAPRSRPNVVTGFASALQLSNPFLPLPVGDPSVPLPAGLDHTLTFDPTRFSSRFLRLDGPRAVACHANCSQRTQGTAFLSPAVRVGEDVPTLRFRCSAKPGRMRYFLGCAPSLFDVDAGQAEIQNAAYSLENLKAAPNRPGEPCNVSSPPCFTPAAL